MRALFTVLPACFALSFLAASSAPAAEVTDIPPRLRGDVHVRYDGAFQQAGLEEDGDVYGIRNVARNNLGLRLEFAAYTGVVVTLGLPINIQQRISFPAARDMLFEPTLGVGSYQGGQPIEAEDVVSGGLQGVWLGVALAPFREDYERSLPITTRFDIGFRTPAAGATMYGANRGGAPGGAALRLAGAFSSRQGKANPYATFDWTQEFGATVEVVANDGTVWADELPIRPDTHVDVTAGAELILGEKVESGFRAALDLYAGFGYRSWEDRPSGFYLPIVLDASKGTVATRSDHLIVRGGLGVDVHINKWVGFRTGAEGLYYTPYTIESLYDVKTDPQTFGVRWNVALVGRIRLKGD